MSDVIDDIIRREGGSKFSNDPIDKGGRTQYGISEKSNPEAWIDGKITEEEARKIFTDKYVTIPGFDKVLDPLLRNQLIDFGVNSGPALAIKKLQEILGVEQDGVLGPKTLKAIKEYKNEASLSNRLMVSRIEMIGRIVQKHPAQAKFLVGWLKRALEFMS